MIKNIIFDIGNVLADFCWEEFFGSFGFAKEKHERIIKATVLSNEWDEFDRGAVPEEEIIQRFIANDPGCEEEIRLLAKDIKDMVKKFDYAIPWIQSFKAKGYNVYYLSNFSEKAKIECAEALDFIPYTDGGILSYEVKLIKPEREIYEMLLSRYDLKAEECVFVDDRKRNCEGAEKVGIKAILFENKEQVENELALLGI